MKRKHYLLALALPAIFAACTQDELVEKGSNEKMQLVENPIENFTLVVGTEDDATTRLSTDLKWELEDGMGLVWFNPKAKLWDGQFHQIDTPEFFANNKFTIVPGQTQGQWGSNATIMAGKHFAYFPFQTVWAEQPQFGGGEEILKVYNTTNQKDDVADRLHWMMNHQTMLSPYYLFNADNQGAGIRDNRQISLHLFSNRLSILPVFLNAPQDLAILSYELKAVRATPEWGVDPMAPFAVEGQINANQLPHVDDFASWLCLNNTCDCSLLGKIYDVTKWESSLEVTYKNAVGVTATMPKFAFLFLPAMIEDFTNGTAEQKQNTKIVMVAHTNYGDITIDKVNGHFDANSPNPFDVTLNKMYFNDESADAVKMGVISSGMFDIAGITRGNGETNKEIAATFDFEDVKVEPITGVCDNADLQAAFDKIKNYKQKLGDAFTEATIVLCPAPTFTSLKYDDFVKNNTPAGVNVIVTGAEDGSTITWAGNGNVLGTTIPETEHLVSGKLRTIGEVDNVITVLSKGTLTNDGELDDVHVNKGGKAINNELIKGLFNEGTVTNSMAKTNLPGDQASIRRLHNRGTVTNYAHIGKLYNTGTVRLFENTTEVVIGGGTRILGALFVIEHAENATGDNGKKGEILFTVDNPKSTTAANSLYTALDNFATTINVLDGINLDASPRTFENVFKGKFWDTEVIFEGTTEFKLGNASNNMNIPIIGKITLAPDANLTLRNHYFDDGNQVPAWSPYCLITVILKLQDSATLNIMGGTQMVAATYFVAENARVAVNTQEALSHSALYYLIKSQKNATAIETGNINLLPSDWYEIIWPPKP